MTEKTRSRTGLPVGKLGTSRLLSMQVLTYVHEKIMGQSKILLFQKQRCDVWFILRKKGHIREIRQETCPTTLARRVRLDQFLHRPFKNQRVVNFQERLV